LGRFLETTADIDSSDIAALTLDSCLCQEAFGEVHISISVFFISKPLGRKT